MIKFYDTNALLFLQEEAFKERDKFLISNITIKELELIKISGTKDEETKWKARHILNLLSENEDKYDIEIYKASYEDDLKILDLPTTEDSKIILCAKQAFIKRECLDKGLFVTQDLSCKKLADIVGLKTSFIKPVQKNAYTGFKTVEFTETTLAEFYNTTLENNKNIFDLLDNQYLLLKYDGNIVDRYRWAGGQYIKINFNKIESNMFGKTVPKDDYQMLAIDSLFNNQITMLRGPAGSGKTWISFAYMFQLLEAGKIDKIIVFCNTVATKGSAKLGYYPGSRTEKLLDSQIGNLLESKLGDRFIVEDYIAKSKLILLPLSDIRGYDTSNMNAAIYISEAQNMDIELMRLTLQRIGEDSICIIDGDYTHQVDMSLYAGSQNGMRRASEVFRGQSFYGEICLQTVYRSKIAAIAENM